MKNNKMLNWGLLSKYRQALMGGRILLLCCTTFFMSPQMALSHVFYYFCFSMFFPCVVTKRIMYQLF